jgi:hypothetical protein
MTGTELTSTVGVVSRPTLFDTRRGLYYPKPVLRGWLHLVWFEASLVTGTLLLAHAHGARHITAVAIYAATVTGLFGTSALYHRGNWGPLAGRWLQRLDDSMIFLLIAGTGTAAFLLTPQSLCSGRPESAVGLTLTRPQRRHVPLGPHTIAAQAGAGSKMRLGKNCGVTTAASAGHPAS